MPVGLFRVRPSLLCKISISLGPSGFLARFLGRTLRLLSIILSSGPEFHGLLTIEEHLVFEMLGQSHGECSRRLHAARTTKHHHHVEEQTTDQHDRRFHHGSLSYFGIASLR